ncbi:MAG: 16S rRNA (cytidine(1402)-2'-O)-methyltransferase [Deltaproteobacteria bacterium]|nr:16S rRNA (cytidine(1402)-2'-O)-methyltransferase [Deltaproteobacteria bacterium]
MQARHGRLFVVATPIGNLEDVTLRSIRVLRECELVLAEDTRRSRTLLTHHAIGTPLRAFHAHTKASVIDEICARLEGGAKIALVTDAGTPMVSDPGAELVAAARARGLDVEALPGASAPLVALCSAGFVASRFRFVGFLPRGGKRRRELLEQIAKDGDAIVLFEAPSRLGATLRDLSASIGDREVAVCRELTKLHEEVVRGTPAALSERFVEARGEITIVIGPTVFEPEEPPDDETLRERASALVEDGLGAKDAADALAESTGIARRDAYRIVLEVKDA